MFTKKLAQVALASTMVLSMGVSVLSVGTEEASAATVISQTAYETIMAFSAEELTQATGVELTVANVQKMYSKLKEAGTWETLGYKGDQAKKVSQRVSLSLSQTQGILKTMANTTGMELKVVYIHNAYYEGVNLGTIMADSTLPETETPEIPETETPTSPSTGLDATIKEIDIELDYKAKNQDIDLDLDVKNNGFIKAEYENEGTKQKLEGEAAKAVVLSVMDGLDVKKMTEVEIANHVTSKLGANQNFKKFAFKVKYFDGSKVEFKIK